MDTQRRLVSQRKHSSDIRIAGASCSHFLRASCSHFLRASCSHFLRTSCSHFLRASCSHFLRPQLVQGLSCQSTTKVQPWPVLSSSCLSTPVLILPFGTRHALYPTYLAAFAALRSLLLVAWKPFSTFCTDMRAPHRLHSKNVRRVADSLTRLESKFLHIWHCT